MLLAEARADGCLFIPFEETSAQVKPVFQMVETTQNQKIMAHLAASKKESAIDILDTKLGNELV